MPADLLAFGLAAALATEPAAPPEEPPVALLEFLGLWTTEDGQWIDPEVLDALPEPDAKAAAPAPPPETEKGSAKGGVDAPEETHE